MFVSGKVDREHDSSATPMDKTFARRLEGKSRPPIPDGLGPVVAVASAPPGRGIPLLHSVVPKTHFGLPHPSKRLGSVGALARAAHGVRYNDLGLGLGRISGIGQRSSSARPNARPDSKSLPLAAARQHNERGTDYSPSYRHARRRCCVSAEGQRGRFAGGSVGGGRNRRRPTV